MDFPSRFRQAIDRLLALQEKPEYLGAFIFGSVARGDATEASDLDVKVVTAASNPVFEILHPTIGGVKLDITFQSLDETQMDIGQDSGKIPARQKFIAESIILFDKTGALQSLKDACPLTAPRHAPSEYAQLRFLVHHADDKVTRHITADPDAALLSMHACLNELLNFHYGIHGHWKVSSKRLLADLREWDPSMASTVSAFLRAPDIAVKYKAWKEIVEQVRVAIGGKMPLDAHEPQTEISKQGLRDLLAGETVVA